MIKRLLIALTAVFVPFVGANAAPDTQIVSDLNRDTLGAALDDLGIAWRVESRGRDGSVTLAAQTPAGLVFYVRSRACDGSRCVGAHLFTVFEDSPFDIRQLDSFNQRHAFSQVGTYERGAYLSRYFIADFGIARGNIEINTAAFLDNAQAFIEEATSSVATVSFQGEAAHTAAESLNKLVAARVESRLKGGAKARLASPHAFAASGHAITPVEIKAVAGDLQSLINAVEKDDRSKLRNFID